MEQPVNQPNSEVETAPQTNQAPAEPVNPLAEQFQRVAKQEKYVAEERRKIEEARKGFESDKEDVSKYRGLKDKDPFEILEHFGISYDKLLEADKNRRTTPVDPIAKKALETVEQLRMELDNKEKEAAKERNSRAEIKLMAEIDNTIRTEEYDLIDKLGEQAAVRAYMEDKYAETGEIPDIKEACQAITDQLVERFTKIKDSKWLKSKEPVVEVERREKEPEHVPEKAANPGLSNKMTQSTIGSTKPLTEKERFKAAIQAMQAMGGK